MTFNRPLQLAVHIEDDPLWGDAVAKIVRERNDIAYGGSALTAHAGKILCAKVRPTLVILDLNLPDADGLELMADIAEGEEPPSVLVLSVRCDDALLYRLGGSAIVGMVWKNQYLPQTLHQALDAACCGRRFLPPEILEAERRLRRSPTAFFKILSNREICLLPLFGRGFSDAEIAQRIGLQPSTVKSHRQHVLHKLGLHSTTTLVRWAIERGFVQQCAGWAACTSTVCAGSGACAGG